MPAPAAAPAQRRVKCRRQRPQIDRPAAQNVPVSVIVVAAERAAQRAARHPNVDHFAQRVAVAVGKAADRAVRDRDRFGLRARQLLFQLDDGVFFGLQRVQQLLHRRRSLRLFGGQHRRNLRDAGVFFAVIGHRVRAALHMNAHAAAESREVQQLDRPDLAGERDVRRAAGADIIALDSHDAHILREVELAAVGHLRKPLRRRVLRADRHVAVHGFVGQLLDVHELRPRELAVIVHRDRDKAFDPERAV